MYVGGGVVAVGASVAVGSAVGSIVGMTVGVGGSVAIAAGGGCVAVAVGAINVAVAAGDSCTWATGGFSRPQAAIMATIATATTTTGSVLANPEPEIRCATLCYAGPNAQS